MKLSKFLCAGALILGAASMAQAATSGSGTTTSTDTAGGFAALDLGLAKPKDLSSRLGYGAEVGLRLDNGVTVSGLFLGSEANDVKILDYGLGFSWGLANMYGLGVGAVVGASTTSVLGLSSTGFMVGPRVQYNYVISGPVSVGADLDWLFTFKNGTSYQLLALANVKYWF